MLLSVYGLGHMRALIKSIKSGLVGKNACASLTANSDALKLEFGHTVRETPEQASGGINDVPFASSLDLCQLASPVLLFQPPLSNLPNPAACMSFAHLEMLPSIVIAL